MKNSIFTLVLIFTFLQFNINAQTSVDSTGLLGDNFSLEGALELFKQSESPEDFEKKLNEEDTYVNNLDLNQDGEIDYIKVIDNMDGDAHAIILQTDINDKESQDIAVIEMEKTGDDQVVLQIVGNEDLYGEDTYVEPAADETNTTSVIVVNNNAAPTSSTVVVNVWAWPSVRYVYGPGYHVWVSPWRWGYYPHYWRPWRPHPWGYYHSRRVHYGVYYRPVRVHRVSRAHRVYAPHRRTSVVVHKRSTSIRVNNKRHKKVVKTQKTTTVGIKKKNNGTIVAGKKTTKTTKVKGKNKTTTKKTTKTTKVKRGKNKTTVKRTKTTKKTRKRKRR